MVQVAADASQDQQSNQRYYTMRVKVDRAQMEKLSAPVELTAGMPAEVFVMTRERTLLQYFSEPILKSFHRAFRED